MAITILDVSNARGVENGTGSVSASEIERVGLPFYCGCENCGESLASYNSYPSKTGYIKCRADLDGLGFDTVAEFEKFIEEALR